MARNVIQAVISKEERQLLQGLAGERGLSESALARAYITKGMQQDIGISEAMPHCKDLSELAALIRTFVPAEHGDALVAMTFRNAHLFREDHVEPKETIQ